MRVATSVSAKVALVATGIVLGLLVAEVIARIVFPPLGFNFSTMRITDDRFTERAGKVMEGNGVRYAFDARGFRTVDASTSGERGPVVLFVGDSFTQGFGVDAERAFPAVTCERLAAQGVSVACLNAGVTGFGTAHELRLLRTLLERGDLDIAAVVFQVLPNNDLRDNWEDGGFAVERGRLVVRDPPRIPFAVRLRVALLENVVARSSQLVKFLANAVIGGEGADPHYDAGAFALEKQLLQEVADTTRRRGIPTVIVVCATAWELESTARTPYDERARLDFVRDTVQTLGVTWIDSRSVAGSPADYIPDDGHFSVAGNAAMGDALAHALHRVLTERRSR